MQFSGGRGHLPPTSIGVRKLRVITFSYGIKILAVCSFFSSQSTHVMDGHNYDPQDRASIAASCGKNDNQVHHQSSFIRA